MQTHITRSVMAVVIVMVAGLLVGASPAIAQLERVINPSSETPLTAGGQPDIRGLAGNKPLPPLARRAVACLATCCYTCALGLLHTPFLEDFCNQVCLRSSSISFA